MDKCDNCISKQNCLRSRYFSRERMLKYADEVCIPIGLLVPPRSAVRMKDGHIVSCTSYVDFDTLDRSS